MMALKRGTSILRKRAIFEETEERVIMKEVGI
jgi:hypothetical protein